jgi:hypothetical protein
MTNKQSQGQEDYNNGLCIPHHAPTQQNNTTGKKTIDHHNDAKQKNMRMSSVL